jgi:hypothetical protein
VISGFGVDMWYGSAASVLVVDAADGVYGGSDGMGPPKAVAAAAALFGLNSGRAVCAVAKRGVLVPLVSSFCKSSREEAVGLRLEFQTTYMVSIVSQEDFGDLL